MKVEIRIKTIDQSKREVTITSDQAETRHRIYTNTNGIFPLFKELIYFCRENRGNALEISSNSTSFVLDLQHLEASGKRLAMMLKDTLVDTGNTIQSITHIKN